MKEALLIVDLQKDFLPGGALAVKNGDEIVPVINHLIDHFDLTLATKDWHPPDHISFAKNHDKKEGEVIQTAMGVKQILWPVHCVQNAPGAEFPESFHGRKVDKIFYKGTKNDVDSYSAFFDTARMSSTGLYRFLADLEIQHLFICGLTTDYCVKFSVMDALDLGFDVYLIQDACKPVNLQADDEEKALEEMQNSGAKLINSTFLIKNKVMNKN